MVNFYTIVMNVNRFYGNENLDIGVAFVTLLPVQTN